MKRHGLVTSRIIPVKSDVEVLRRPADNNEADVSSGIYGESIDATICFHDFFERLEREVKYT